MYYVCGVACMCCFHVQDTYPAILVLQMRVGMAKLETQSYTPSGSETRLLEIENKQRTFTPQLGNKRKSGRPSHVRSSLI